MKPKRGALLALFLKALTPGEIVVLLLGLMAAMVYVVVFDVLGLNPWW